MSDLLRLIENFHDRRIVVFGDLVADVFVFGETSRVSREAPVLVLNHRETQLVPGGAANAIHNLRTMGANPVPVGIVGDDSEGHELLEFFRNLGIDTRGIHVTKAYRTPTKTRILGGGVHSHRQQIVRMDSGAALADDKARTEVERKLQRAVRSAEGILISDYGYALVDPKTVARVCNGTIPSTIDSRFAMAQYVGLTAATPNEPEVEAALGITIGNDLKKLETAGRTLLRKLKHEALLITRGRDGMALFERGKKTRHISIHGTDEIADVTGAGDTVIATFTLALAAGGSFAEAAELANYAGGIVVMKYGTRPVFRKELEEAIEAAAD